MATTISGLTDEDITTTGTVGSGTPRMSADPDATDATDATDTSDESDSTDTSDSADSADVDSTDATDGDGDVDASDS